MEFLNKLIDIYQKNKGPLNGAVAGFVISVTVLIIGALRCFFIVACVIAGYILGKLLSEKKEPLKKLLERILPGKFFD